MFIDRNQFEEWMRRIMERFDQMEKKLDKPDKPRHEIDGERLLDNTDLCLLLNCSKRTLQRFRMSGLLPHRRISQKTYYLESEVKVFIREHLKEAGKK